MPVLLGRDHLLHHVTLLDGQLLRVGLRARGGVLQFAFLLSFPRVVPRLRKTEEAKRGSNGEYLARAIDGTEEKTFLLALANAATDE